MMFEDVCRKGGGVGNKCTKRASDNLWRLDFRHQRTIWFCVSIYKYEKHKFAFNWNYCFVTS